jgi:hypothetical protein
LWGHFEGTKRKKLKTLKIRLTEREYAAWAAKAEALGVTMSEFVRQRWRSAGKPPKARRPAEPRCEHDVAESQECPLCLAVEQAELDRQAAEAERIAALNEKWKVERERRQEAERLAQASGRCVPLVGYDVEPGQGEMGRLGADANRR